MRSRTRGKNPYAAYIGAAPDPSARGQAGMFDALGNAAPGIGAAAGGLIGLIGGPAGAGVGAGIGGALGSVAGGMAKDYGASLNDPERERELRKQALLEAISGLRGF